MQKRTIILLGLVFGGCLTLSVVADEKPPTFFFGGQQVYVDMPKRDAVAALSHCCKLSPPVDVEIEKQSAPTGGMLGHFIISGEESTQRMLGTIYFSGGKVVRVTRPLAEDVDGYNDDVVGFARAIKRTLAAEGDTEMTAIVSVGHERISNAESDVVLLTLRDGRGIEIHIGTLDKPNALTDKRDFATIDEILEPAGQRSRPK